MAGRNAKSRYAKELKAGWPAWVAAIAVLLFGLALLIWPGITADLILNICGCALIIAGAFCIIRYFVKKDSYLAYNWSLAMGLLLLTGGISLVALKGLLLAIVPLLFGIALLVAGIAKVQAAFNMQRMHFRSWYLTLIAAAISCVLGLLIILHPFGTGLVLIRVIGASIAIEAVQDLLSLRTYNRVITSHFVD